MQRFFKHGFAGLEIIVLVALVVGIAAAARLVQTNKLTPSHASLCCNGGTCNDGWSYGDDPNAPQSTCEQRAQEACSQHGGPASGGGACTVTVDHSNTCSSGGVTASVCYNQAAGNPCPNFPGTCVKTGTDSSGYATCGCVATYPTATPAPACIATGSYCANQPSPCCDPAARCTTVCLVPLTPTPNPLSCTGTPLYRCSGSTLQSCRSGLWSTVQSCPTGTTCDALHGQCVAPTPTINPLSCTGTGSRCSGTVSQTCRSGLWTVNPACLYGCDTTTGICKPAPTPTINPLSCTGTPLYRCSGTTLQSCRSGLWSTVQSCPTGTTCDATHGQCVAPTATPTRIPTLVPTHTPTPIPAPTCSSTLTACSTNNVIGSNTCSQNGLTMHCCPVGYAISSGVCVAPTNTPTHTPTPIPPSYCSGTTLNRCVSGSQQTCISNSWITTISCPAGCNTSGTSCAPTPNPLSCTGTGSRCSGTQSQICRNGLWTLNVNCQYGCNTTTGVCDPQPAARPTVNIVANNATSVTVAVGTSITLNWYSSGSTSCAASGYWSGAKPTGGSENLTVMTTGTKNYSLSCTGPGGTTTSYATVTVQTAPPPTTLVPEVRLLANSLVTATVNNGGSVILSWTANSASRCSAGGFWTGEKPLAGTETVLDLPSGYRTYALTCTGPGGTTTRSATVTVLPPVEGERPSPTPTPIPGKGLTTTESSGARNAALVPWTGYYCINASICKIGLNTQCTVCANCTGLPGLATCPSALPQSAPPVSVTVTPTGSPTGSTGLPSTNPITTIIDQVFAAITDTFTRIFNFR